MQLVEIADANTAFLNIFNTNMAYWQSQGGWWHGDRGAVMDHSGMAHPGVDLPRQPAQHCTRVFIYGSLLTARSRRGVVHDSARCVAAPFFD